MSTGLKIALIGCGLLLIICVVALGVGGYFAKKWLGEGVETVKNITGSEDSHYGKKIAELNQQYPFTPSPDSLITDKQLQRFLNVRKSLFMVYKNHEAEFEKLKDPNAPGFETAFKGFSLMKDMRLTQAKALQDQHMSLDEYRFMVTAVYLTWATKVTKDVAPMMDSAAEGLKKSIGELDKQIADSNIPESAKEQLKKVEMRCSLNLIQYRKM